MTTPAWRALLVAWSLAIMLGCAGEPEPTEQEASAAAQGEDAVETLDDAASPWRAELEQAQEMIRSLRADQALDAFVSIETRALAADEPAIAVEALLGQADVLRESGDPQGAVERLGVALRRAESLIETSADDRLARRWTAKVLRQRAQALSRRGGEGIVTAEDDLARASELFASLDDAASVAGVEATRSVLAAQTGRHLDAVDHGRAALAALETLDPESAPTAESLGALSAVAYGLHQLRRLDEALAAYEELIDGAWQRNDQRLLLFAFCNRAEILHATGALDASESDLRAAIERIEGDRLRLPTGPDARSAMLERQVAAYDRMIRLLVDTYRSDEAFAFTERFRARSFLDLLALAGKDAAGEDAAGEDTAGVRAPPTEATAPTLDQVRGLLAEGQALVSYWLLDDRILAWVVLPERAHFVQVPIDRGLLAGRVADYLEEIRSPALARTAALAGAEAQHLALGLDLHRHLLASLPAAARDAETLLVVSDGVLHYLPLEALPSECAESGSDDGALFAAYAGCTWHGLRQAVTYLPSAAVLAELRRRTRDESPRSALLLAPDPAEGRPALAAARRETMEIESLLPGSLRLAGAQATESAVGAATSAGPLRYLHFAAHGRIIDDDPLASGIELSPGAADDGLLQAREVLGLDLPCELVVLAACRSGRGVLRRGEGLVGLTRAFLTAGAGAVVVSLWDVDDQASARLMRSFYTALAEGTAPPEALRAARQELAAEQTEVPSVFRTRSAHYAHPSFWAPYVVVGTP